LSFKSTRPLNCLTVAPDLTTAIKIVSRPKSLFSCRVQMCIMKFYFKNKKKILKSKCTIDYYRVRQFPLNTNLTIGDSSKNLKRLYHKGEGKRRVETQNK